MKKSIYVTARLEAVVSPHDLTLLEYVSALRRSVIATVFAERRRGISLAQIVVHVREMVRLREEATDPLAETSSLAFRAISKCAAGWCIDAYLPPVADRSHDRFPLRSPT